MFKILRTPKPLYSIKESLSNVWRISYVAFWFDDDTKSIRIKGKTDLRNDLFLTSIIYYFTFII